MSEPPGTLRAALLLARKDLLLEARSPELVAGVGLFSLAALVALHFAVAGGGQVVSGGLAGGVLWVVDHPRRHPRPEPRVLGRAGRRHHRRAAADSGQPERDLALEGAGARRDARAHRDRRRAAALALLLHRGDHHAPALGARRRASLLADLGLASVGALVAALASPARLREVLLPVMFLPIATPALIVGIEVTKNAAEGGPVARYLALLALYDAIFAVIAWGTTEFVLTD